MYIYIYIYIYIYKILVVKQIRDFQLVGQKEWGSGGRCEPPSGSRAKPWWGTGLIMLHITVKYKEIAKK